MKSSEISTGETYLTYKALCKEIRQKRTNSEKSLHKCLVRFEMSGIISGRIVHQGTHGNTKEIQNYNIS